LLKTKPTLRRKAKYRSMAAIMDSPLAMAERHREAKDIDLGVVGAHVDAAVAQDQADLVERDATAQHLRAPCAATHERP